MGDGLPQRRRQCVELIQRQRLTAGKTGGGRAELRGGRRQARIGLVYRERQTLNDVWNLFPKAGFTLRADGRRYADRELVQPGGPYDDRVDASTTQRHSATVGGEV